MEPFLSVARFTAMFRPLSSEEAKLAAPLLDVVSEWIRANKPGISPDDPAAIVVCFQVLRTALTHGKYAGLASFTETVAHRTRSGAFDTRTAEAIGRLITDSHRLLLGIALVGEPAYCFKEFDY